MRAPLQQGQADGMCGLYAVLNFLNRTEWRDAPKKGLSYLLDACRHFGWLTPQNLTEGFEDYQLKSILDFQIANYRLAFETHFLSDVADAIEDLDHGTLIRRIVAKGGAVIIQTQSEKHWVLVDKHKGEAFVCDSAAPAGALRPLPDRRLSSALDWGVVILPCERAKLVVTI